jgi:predicted metal-dependent hydrolase
MDNAFLNAKASVLEKKLAYLQTRARNHEWVDSVLKILDKKKHQQLKRSFQKKMGVSF